MTASGKAGLVPVAVPAEWLKPDPKHLPPAESRGTHGDVAVEMVQVSAPLARLISGVGITAAGAGGEVLRWLVRLEVAGAGTTLVGTLESLAEAAETSSTA